MQSIQLKSNIGQDGILKLQIPTDMPEQEIEVLIVMQPVHQTKKYLSGTKKWPDNFFEKVVGEWMGDLSRPAQGNFELREDL